MKVDGSSKFELRRAHGASVGAVAAKWSVKPLAVMRMARRHWNLSLCLWRSGEQRART